jgi:hypothetical protein
MHNRHALCAAALVRAEDRPAEVKIARLEQQVWLGSRFAELERQLDAKQTKKATAKRRAKGQGPPGPRGSRGDRGERGQSGADAKRPVLVGWKVDVKNFRAVPFGGDGKPLPELNLRPLAQAIVDAAVCRSRPARLRPLQ